MYRTRVPWPHSAGSLSRSSADRKAANVLPEPVGADSSTCSARAIAGQACVCACVGSPKADSNHFSTWGAKPPGSIPLAIPRAPSGDSGYVLQQNVERNPERPRELHQRVDAHQLLSVLDRADQRTVQVGVGRERLLAQPCFSTVALDVLAQLSEDRLHKRNLRPAADKSLRTIVCTSNYFGSPSCCPYCRA